MKVGVLQGTDGRVVQTTEPREAAKNRLAMVAIEPPPSVLGMATTAPATWYQRLGG